MAIGIALEAVGYRIVSLIGRRRQTVRKAAAVLNVTGELLTADELRGHAPGDLVIVAVPDDRIPEVAAGLLTVEVDHRRTVLHTSGALSSSRVFRQLTVKRWRTGSIHPLLAISNPLSGASQLRTAYWCVEGDPMAARVARRLVRDLGARSFSIDSKDKPLYHAAAVMSSGNVVALFDIALEMLRRCGLPRRKAQAILLPLLESTIANLSQSQPEDAITGTFARGDLTTIAMHLNTLNQKNLGEALELYRLLGRHSLELARNNLSTEVINEIRKLLR